MRRTTSLGILCAFATIGYVYVATAPGFPVPVHPHETRAAVDTNALVGQVNEARQGAHFDLATYLGANAQVLAGTSGKPDAGVAAELKNAAVGGAHSVALVPAPEFEVERKRFDLFVNEARDSSWANQAEETLERELSNSVPASTAVQNVECRTAVCRVATIHADLAAYTKYLLRLKDPDAPIWPADALTLETAYDHEQVLAISYFFREGPVP